VHPALWVVAHAATDRTRGADPGQIGERHARHVEVDGLAPHVERETGSAFDLRVGRTGVAVDFRSEAARIDLNAAPADLLAGLFAAVGVDLTDVFLVLENEGVEKFVESWTELLTETQKQLGSVDK